MSVPKTHVVVSVYTFPNGRVLSHAYGPMSAEKARVERQKMKRQNAAEVEAGRLFVSVNKMIDIEAMNEEANRK